MLGALSYGLPQLMLPQGADQFRNAALCVRTNAAIALQPPEATAEAIHASTIHLFRDSAYSNAAQRVRAELAEMPEMSEAIAVLVSAPKQGPRST
jgi:UDP:flavonoid glycosyltransferase YjiC (YdhE family)